MREGAATAGRGGVSRVRREKRNAHVYKKEPEGKGRNSPAQGM